MSTCTGYMHFRSKQYFGVCRRLSVCNVLARPHQKRKRDNPKPNTFHFEIDVSLLVYCIYNAEIIGSFSICSLSPDNLHGMHHIYLIPQMEWTENVHTIHMAMK